MREPSHHSQGGRGGRGGGQPHTLHSSPVFLAGRKYNNPIIVRQQCNTWNAQIASSSDKEGELEAGTDRGTEEELLFLLAGAVRKAGYPEIHLQAPSPAVERVVSEGALQATSPVSSLSTPTPTDPRRFLTHWFPGEPITDKTPERNRKQMCGFDARGPNLELWRRGRGKGRGKGRGQGGVEVGGKAQR